MIRQRSFRNVTNDDKEEIFKDVAKQLSTVDKKKFFSVFKEAGMRHREADVAWESLENILSKAGFTHQQPKEKKIKQDIKQKVNNIAEMKKSLGDRAKDMSVDELLILFKTLSKMGYFSKGGDKEEMLEEALQEAKA
jgi:hypothetical protein